MSPGKEQPDIWFLCDIMIDICCRSPHYACPEVIRVRQDISRCCTSVVLYHCDIFFLYVFLITFFIWINWTSKCIDLFERMCKALKHGSSGFDRNALIMKIIVDINTRYKPFIERLMIQHWKWQIMSLKLRLLLLFSVHTELW